MSLPEPFVARLVGAKNLTNWVRELEFERIDGVPLSYEAGQWVNLAMPLGTGKDKRSYSIASAPRGTPRFEIAVTRVEGGPGSTYLHGMDLGAEIEVHGPSGFFVRRNEDAALFVGTGTGLTPLRSMLYDALERKGEHTPMHVLSGFRYTTDVLYQEEFAELGRTHGNLSVDCTLSRPSGEWSGRTGYVQTHVRALYEALQARAEGRAVHVYICGLQKMVAEVRDLLRKQMNLPRELVHSERYD